MPASSYAAQLVAEITADLTGLDKGVASAQAKMQKLTEAIGGTSSTAQSKWSAAFGGMADSAGKAFEKVQNFIEGTSGKLETFSRKVRQLGTELTVGLTLPIAEIFKMGLGFDDVKNRATIAFSTMLHSSDLAKKFVDDLQKFDLKTPILFSKTLEAAQRLKMMGFDLQNIIPTIKAITDSLAVSGKGVTSFDNIILAMGEMNAGGNLMERQLRMLTNDGVAAFELLSKHMGISTQQLMDLTRKGAIPAKEAVQALLYEMEKQAPDGASAMLKTLQGAWTNIQNFAEQTLGELFEPLYKDAVKVLNQSMTKLGEFKEKVAGWSDDLKKKWTAAFISTASIGPILLVISGLSKAFSLLLNPVGLVAMAVAGLTYYLMTHKKEAESLTNFLKDHQAQILKDMQRIFLDLGTIIHDLAPIIVAALPALVDLLHTVRGLLDMFTSLPKPLRDTLLGLLAFGGKIPSIIEGVGGLGRAFGVTAAEGVAAFGPGAAVVIALAALAFELKSLADLWADVKDAQDQAAASAQGFADAQSRLATEGEKGALMANQNAIASTLQNRKDALEALQNKISDMQSSGAASGPLGQQQIYAMQHGGQYADTTRDSILGIFQTVKAKDSIDGLNAAIKQLGIDYKKEADRLHEIHGNLLISGHTQLGDSIAIKAAHMEASGEAAKYVHMCQGLATVMHDGVPAFSKYMAGAHSATEALSNFQKQGLAHPYTAGQTLSPGDMLYSTTLGYEKGKDGKMHNFGHVQTIGPDGERLDQYGKNHFNQRDFQYYVSAQEVAGHKYASGYNTTPDVNPKNPGKIHLDDGKDAERLIKKYQQVYQEKLKAVELYNVEDEKTKMIWETEKGEYKDFSAGQKASLIGLAAKIDKLDAAAEATKKYNKIVEDSSKDAAELAKTIAIGSDATDYQTKKYDLAHLTLTGLTAEEKKHVESQNVHILATARAAEANKALSELWQQQAMNQLPEWKRKIVEAVGGLQTWIDLTDKEKGKAITLFQNNEATDRADTFAKSVSDLRFEISSMGNDALQAAVQVAGGSEAWGKYTKDQQDLILALTGEKDAATKAKDAEDDLNKKRDEARKTLAKMTDEVNLKFGEIQAKITGTFNPADDAVQKWLVSNEEVVKTLEGMGMTLDNIKAKIKATFAAQDIIKTVDDLKSAVDDFNGFQSKDFGNEGKQNIDGLKGLSQALANLKVPDELKGQLRDLKQEVAETTALVERANKIAGSITDVFTTAISDSFFKNVNQDMTGTKNSLAQLQAQQKSYQALMRDNPNDPRMAQWKQQVAQLDSQAKKLNQQINATHNGLYGAFQKLFASIYQGFVHMLQNMAQDILKQKIGQAVQGVVNKVLGVGSKMDATAMAAQRLMAAATQQAAAATQLASADAALTTGSTALTTGATTMTAAATGITTAATTQTAMLSGAAGATSGAAGVLAATGGELSVAASMLMAAASMLMAAAGTKMAMAGFATGGDVLGGVPIKVGEWGTEVFVPRTSGTIISNRMLNRKRNGNVYVGNNEGGTSMYADAGTTLFNNNSRGGDTHHHYNFNYAINSNRPEDFHTVQSTTISKARKAADREFRRSR